MSETRRDGTGAAMRILPAGVDGLIVEVDGLDQALALFRSLDAEPVPGVVELVPAARTVYLRFARARASARSVADAVLSRRLRVGASEEGPLIRIPVAYDGEDLAEIASIAGMTPEEVVARHSVAAYTVAFTGFAPGFAYIAGGDPALHMPRRATPRTAIPAGAVALAGEFTGIYPRSSPGGWQLLGQTDETMWDLRRDPPALLRPGARVEFSPRRAVARGASGSDAGGAQVVRSDDPVAPEGASSRDSGRAPSMPGDAARAAADEATPALEVVAPSPHALMQDLGRTGVASLGVSRSGAMDRAALRRANRLVGNVENSATIESALGGLEVRARGPVTVAIAGATVTARILTARGAHRAAPLELPFALGDGDILSLDPPDRGVYSYLAARGGFDVEPVLGSVARDVLSALGPAPLSPGQIVPIGRRVAGAVSDRREPVASPPAVDEITWLDVVLGPRTDWCAPDAVATLTEQEWFVGAQSNRVGLRLHGDSPLGRAVTAELPSEATPAGALQVPASGQPVLFTADHPLTGGYPVIGVVVDRDLDRASQVPPGGRIRFRVASGFVDHARS